jgi:hypothetical protein
MAKDLELMSPDELQEYLKWAKGDAAPAEEALEAARESQYLSESAARAEKPLGKLGDVIKPTLPKTPPTPITDLPTPRIMDAREKLAQAARGSAGEGVIAMADPNVSPITDLPSGRMLDAREKLAQAARGSAGEGVIQVADTRSTFSKLMDNPRLQSALSKIKGVGSSVAESPIGKAVGRFAGPIGEGLLLGDIVETVGQASPSEMRAERQRIADLAMKDMYARKGITPPQGLPTPAEFRPGVSPIPPSARMQDDLVKPVVSEEEEGDSVPSEKPDQKLSGQPSSPTPSVSKTSPAEQQIPQAQEVLTKEAPQEPSLSDRYKEMMDRMENITMMNQLAKAAAQVGSAIPAVTGVAGMVKPTTVDTKIFDENIALAQRLPEQFKQQLEVEHKDPKSQDSIAARKFLKDSLNVAIPDNISAAQLKEQFPVIERMLATRENIKMREEVSKRHAESLQIQREALKEQKDARLIESTIKSLENDKQIQTLNTRLNSIQRGKEMLDANLPLTPELFADVMREVATGMTGTSTVAQAFVKKTDIQTLQRTLSQYKQYFTGEPEDLKKVQPKIINYVRDILGSMNKGFEHDKQKRYKELVERRVAATPSESVKTSLRSFLKEAAPIKEKTETTNTYSPGSIVKVRGKQYRVGSDGDSLEEL